MAEYRNGGGKYDDGMPPETRRVVVNQLLEEQNYLCAYCCASINSKTMKIEHWKTRTNHPDQDLVYTNLLAVCYGDRFCSTELHCDRSREEKTELTITPLRKDQIDKVFFEKGTGRINSSDPELAFDLITPKRLNLNCNLLTKQRSTVLARFRNALESKRKRELRKNNNYSPNFTRLLVNQVASREGFNDIIIEYLRKKVQQ
ncbi:MAG: retron system putative HNH endonuclease [Lewinella sp.]